MKPSTHRNSVLKDIQRDSTTRSISWGKNTPSPTYPIGGSGKVRQF